MPNIVSSHVSFMGVTWDTRNRWWLVEFSITANGHEIKITVPVEASTLPDKVVAEGQSNLHEILQKSAEETKNWLLP